MSADHANLTSTTRVADLAHFTRWQLASGDIDPVYPVLAYLTDGWSAEDQVRFVFLYVAFYDLGSALRVWRSGWRGGPVRSPLNVSPTGVERRGLRGGARLDEHLMALDDWVGISRAGGYRDAFLPPPGLNPRSAWHWLQSQLRSVHGNGRWAAYKTGEILKTVCGWQVEPTDAGHDFSTGPRKGLALFFDDVPEYGNQPDVVARLDQQTTWLRTRLEYDYNLAIPVEQLETMLCDFHALLGGRYYVGHDLDVMLTQALRQGDEEQELLLDARAEVFHPRWLGEHQTPDRAWSGVRKPLLRLYADRGVIEWW